MPNRAVILVHGVSGERNDEGTLLLHFAKNVLSGYQKSSQTAKPIDSWMTERWTKGHETIDLFEVKWQSEVNVVSGACCLLWSMKQILRKPFQSDCVDPRTSGYLKLLPLITLFALAFVGLFIMLSIVTNFIHKAWWVDGIRISAMYIVAIGLAVCFKCLATALLNGSCRLNPCCSIMRKAVTYPLIVAMYLSLFLPILLEWVIWPPLIVSLPLCIVLSIAIMSAIMRVCEIKALRNIRSVIIGVCKVDVFRNIISDIKEYTGCEPTRNRILAVVDKVIKIVTSGTECSTLNYDDITIIGHSLGAQIVADAITLLSTSMTPKAMNVITFGGAIGSLSTFLSDVKMPFQKMITNNGTIQNVQTWTNLWIDQELLGLPLGSIGEVPIYDCQIRMKREHWLRLLIPGAAVLESVNLHSIYLIGNGFSDFYHSSNLSTLNFVTPQPRQHLC